MGTRDQLGLVLCLIAVPGTFLLSLVLWFVFGTLRSRRVRGRSLACLQDPARPAAERAAAADGLAEYARTDPVAQEALRVAAKDADGYVRARARAVLLPSLPPPAVDTAAPTVKEGLLTDPLAAQLAPTFAQLLDHPDAYFNGAVHYARQPDGSFLIQRGARSGPQFRPGPVRSACGRHEAQLATHGKGRWQLVVGGRPEGEYEQIDDSSLVFSPDGSRWAYAARRRKSAYAAAARWVVVADGAETRAYGSILGLAFSPDGARLGYTAEDGDENYAVVDGKRRAGEYGGYVHGVVFGPDGKHFAYWTNKWAPLTPGKMFVDGALLDRGKTALGLDRGHNLIVHAAFVTPSLFRYVCAAPRENTFTEDVGDILRSRIARRYDVAVVEVHVS